MIRTVWLEHGAVHLVDQTRLPQELQLVSCSTPEEVADAIRTLRVRGAPAIGVTAAYGMALAASRAVDLSTTSDSGERVAVAEVLAAVEQAATILVATRPTAVNLNWAAQRMLTVARRAADGAAPPDAAGVAERLRQEADTIAAEDRAANEAIGRLGETLIRPGERIMTYCHTGGLATAGYGTAFGILRAAHETGKGIHVIACETRPVLQGARLTAWELQHYGVPTTLITDNAAAALMARGEIDRVIVGADRIAANGDVANKIGTYALAVLAHAHALPFIVAAPTSTIDLAAPDGGSIPIEERAASEVTHAGGRRVAPEGVTVRNPAFDVTPHHLVNAIVTEGGIARPPYDRSLAELVGVVTRST